MFIQSEQYGQDMFCLKIPIGNDVHEDTAYIFEKGQVLATHASNHSVSMRVQLSCKTVTGL